MLKLPRSHPHSGLPVMRQRYGFAITFRKDADKLGKVSKIDRISWIESMATSDGLIHMWCSTRSIFAITTE